MDGEANGGQKATQGAQDQTQQQGRSQVDSTSDYEKQIAERDEKIASLEAQVAEAAKNGETAEQLRGRSARTTGRRASRSAGHRPTGVLGATHEVDRLRGERLLRGSQSWQACRLVSN